MRQSSAVLVGFFSLLLTLSGCYEGWDDYRKRTGSGDDPTDNPQPTPQIKPIYYVLFQTVSLSGDAITNPTCFANQGERDYRANEWTSRAAKAKAALAEIAEEFVTNDVAINAGDCTTLSRIEAASLNSAPWGTETPGVDSLGRKLVHVKMVLWDDDVAVVPPATVVSRDWLAWRTLQNGGRDAVSLTYFVQSNAANGYFEQWQRTANVDGVMSGTVLDNVDPSPTGITARDAVIATDTEALVQRVLAL